MQESSCLQNHTSLCDGFNVLNLLICDGDFPSMRKNVLYSTVMYCVESVNVCLRMFMLHLGCLYITCWETSAAAYFDCLNICWKLNRRIWHLPSVANDTQSFSAVTWFIWNCEWLSEYYSLNIQPLDLLFLCSTALLITVWYDIKFIYCWDCLEV